MEKLAEGAGVDRGEAAPDFRGAECGGRADARRHAGRSTGKDTLLGEGLADRGAVLARRGGVACMVAWCIHFARGIPSVAAGGGNALLFAGGAELNADITSSNQTVKTDLEITSNWRLRVYLLVANEHLAIGHGHKRACAIRRRAWRSTGAVDASSDPGLTAPAAQRADPDDASHAYIYVDHACPAQIDRELVQSRRTKTSIEQNRTNDNICFCTAVHTGLLNQSVL